MFKKFFILILLLILILVTVALQPCSTPDEFKFSQILEAVEKGEYSIAVRQIEQIVPKENSNLQYQMYYVLGKCFSAMGQWDKAAESYQQSIVPTSEISDYATYHVAQCYENMEDYENADYWYEQFIKKYPTSFNSPSALYHLSKCYLQLKKYQLALDTDNQLIDKHAKGYVRLATFNKAKAYEGLKQWRKAKLFYQKVIDANKSDQTARDALSAIQRLVAEHKDLKITRSQYFTHGMVMYNAKECESARRFFRKARLNYKDSLAARTAYYIAKSYYRQRKYISAISEYQRVAKNYPNSIYFTTALYRIPLCYRQRGYLTKAAKLYKEFAEKYPWSKFADHALYNRADIFKNQGKYISAIRAYDLLIHKYTKSRFLDDVLWWKGLCQFNLKKYRDSLVTFKSLTSRFPRSKYASQAEYWIGKSYDAMKQWKNAVVSYKKVIEENCWYYSIKAEGRVKLLIENKKISDSNHKDCLLGGQKVIPHYRVRSSADKDFWDNIPKFVTSRIALLMKLKAFDDAIVELEGTRKQTYINHRSMYYNLIICSQKIGDYQQAYSYVNILSKFLPKKTSDGLNPIEIHKLLYPFYFKELIYEYSAKYEVDPLFVAAMIREESKYDVKAISWANAYGLMQIIPSTGRHVASKIGIKNFRTSMLHQPEINIHIGVWYTKYLLDQFKNYALVSGAYNCGPGRIKRLIKRNGLNDLDKFIENIPIYETRNHIKKVMDTYRIYKELFGLMIDD